MLCGRSRCALGMLSRWWEKGRGRRSRQHTGKEEVILAGHWSGFSKEYTKPWKIGWTVIVWLSVLTRSQLPNIASLASLTFTLFSPHVIKLQQLVVTSRKPDLVGAAWNSSMKQKVTGSLYPANSTLLNSSMRILFTVICATLYLCAFLSDLFLSFRYQVSWLKADARCPTEDQAEKRGTVSCSALCEATWTSKC